MPDKCIALLSGGIDSTVSLAWADNNPDLEVVEALTFDYGQTHVTELMSAEAVAKYYDVPWKKMYLPFTHIWPTEVGKLLEQKLDIAEAGKTVKDWLGNDVSATFVPGRNIIFLS